MYVGDVVGIGVGFPGRYVGFNVGSGVGAFVVHSLTQFIVASLTILIDILKYEDVAATFTKVLWKVPSLTFKMSNSLKEVQIL